MYQKALILIILLCCSVSHAKPFYKSHNFEQKNGKFNFNVLFDEALSDKEIEVNYFSNIIQLSIPNSIVMRKKEIKPDNTQKIEKVSLYQYDKETMRVRIIFEKGFDAASVTDKFDAVKSGKKLKLNLENFTNLKPSFELTQRLDEIEKEVQEKTIEKVVAAASITDDSRLDNAKTAAANLSVKSNINREPASFNSGLQSLFYAAVGLLLAALLFVFFGSFQRKKKIFNSNSFVHVSDEYSLGLFQKLLVVEIEGTQYLFIKNIFKTRFVSKIESPHYVSEYIQKAV